MQLKIRYPIRRMLLGTSLAALAFALFGRLGVGGVLVGSVIGLSLLAISLIADKDRLDWALGICIFAGTGLGIAALIPSVGRIEDMQSRCVAFTLIGAIAGYLICQNNLQRIQARRKLTESDSETK